MKKIIKVISSKVVFFGLLLSAQLIFLIFLVNRLANNDYIGVYVHIFFTVFSVIVVLHIISSDINPEFKIGWLVPIVAFPVLGTFFYMFYRANNVRPSHVRKYSEITKNRKILLKDIPNQLKTKEIAYLNEQGWRYYKNTKTTYYDSGEEKFEDLLRELRKAEKFILLEYFIISKGYMFDEILSILVEKARKGVEVKILYDDFGSADKKGFNFRKRMRKLKIETVPFNKITFHINFIQNYRTHRKIVVIDNKVGFTGGANIGDEYINKIDRFGHWKDSAIKLEGDAVWSLTLTFLENWVFAKKEMIDFTKYYVEHSIESSEIVAPFSDSPIENKQITKSVLLYLINEAKEEINITTPYLVLDNELITALRLARKSGVSVNIIIPGIPDKKLIYLVTESYALDLAKYGINIYKYAKGFVHSKMFVIDGKKAIIGTTNLDFRSLYLHFENNVYLDNSHSVDEINVSMRKTIGESLLVGPVSLEKNLFTRMFQAVLRGFSSLL